MGELKPNINTSLFKIDSERMSSKSRSGNITPIPLEQVEKEFNGFEAIDMSDPEHQEELQVLFPNFLLKTCDDADWQLFQSMGRYDRNNHLFVTGCFENQDMKFKLISYKWRYKDNTKWKTRAGTSPNGNLFIRIFSEDRPVYAVEGHRDGLTAVLLGLDFIMIPYAGFKLRDIVLLKKEVSGRKVVFLVEDKAAYNCMKDVAVHLTDTAKRILLKELSHTGPKIDLSDYVQHFNTIKEVENGLRQD
jgi:hypothetical protein